MIKAIKKTGTRTKEVVLEIIKALPAILATALEIVRMIKKPK